MGKWGEYRRWDKADVIYDRKRPIEIDTDEDDDKE